MEKCLLENNNVPGWILLYLEKVLQPSLSSLLAWLYSCQQSVETTDSTCSLIFNEDQG